MSKALSTLVLSLAALTAAPSQAQAVIDGLEFTTFRDLDFPRCCGFTTDGVGATNASIGTGETRGFAEFDLRGFNFGVPFLSPTPTLVELSFIVISQPSNGPENLTVALDSYLTGDLMPSVLDAVTPVGERLATFSSDAGVPGSRLSFNITTPFNGSALEGRTAYGVRVTLGPTTILGVGQGVVYDDFRLAFTGVAQPVPEPETWAAMTLGLALLGWKVRRRSKPQPALHRPH